MTEEKPDLIGRIHKALGLKISPEEQARIDRIKREGAAANAKLKQAFDADLERRRRGLEATAAQQQTAQTAVAKASEQQVAHMPRQLGSVNDENAIMKALKSGEAIASVRNRTTIYQWNDGDGNILYLNPDVPMNQIKVVSARITEQKGAFDALGADRQTRIRTDFSLSKRVVAKSTQPYMDYLKSEALGRRFQKLQQSSPTPK